LDRLRRPGIAVALLQEYPVLARQLALRINQWAEFSLEFLARLAADWCTIPTSLGSEGDSGMLVEVTGGAGDRHRGGRSVAIAKFSSGLRLVYKPRSLSVDVHFQELLEWLNTRAGWAPFRTLRVLDRGEYGWVEYVAARGCSSTEELTRFYERQGAYLAVLYALEATDFHFENLIAAGEHPVLPDLEALFHPRIDAADLRQAEALAGNAIAHSVTRVGLLPQLGWGTGESAGVDLSGLGSVEGQLTPRPVPQWEGEGTDEMRQVSKRVEMPAGHNRPALDGARVDVLEYAEAIVSGFNTLYRCLLNHRNELLAGDGPVARFATDEVRVILRATPPMRRCCTKAFTRTFCAMPWIAIVSSTVYGPRWRNRPTLRTSSWRSARRSKTGMSRFSLRVRRRVTCGRTRPISFPISSRSREWSWLGAAFSR
jgi:type 2 lantibiotic biosynthesis protein LanM